VDGIHVAITGGEQPEAFGVSRPDHIGDVDLGAEHLAQAVFERHIEQRVKRGAADVAIDKQSATTGAGLGSRRVGWTRLCAHFHRARTSDQDDLPALRRGIVHELGPHAVDRLSKLGNNRMIRIEHIAS